MAAIVQDGIWRLSHVSCLSVMDSRLSTKFVWQMAKGQTIKTYMHHNCIIDHESQQYSWFE